MPHPHLWPRLTVPVIALLLGTLVAAPTRAEDGPSVAETTDYSLTVHPERTGPAISDSMYGVFYEDINHAADGGLYAELVQNRSFEYDRADNAAYSPMTAWSTASVAGGAGRAETVDDDQRLHERNRRYLRLDLDGTGGRGAGFGVTNSGYNQGLTLRKGERYDFSVWARTDRPAGTALTVGATTADGTAVTA
ncbi:MAG TPA: alpha-N-arabinofuranosidase, partial [Streptomyces sp.]|nr:alpha-N-arabinofuranosidase [Streptomyces sp.]